MRELRVYLIMPNYKFHALLFVLVLLTTTLCSSAQHIGLRIKTISYAGEYDYWYTDGEDMVYKFKSYKNSDELVIRQDSNTSENFAQGPITFELEGIKAKVENITSLYRNYHSALPVYLQEYHNRIRGHFCLDGPMLALNNENDTIALYHYLDGARHGLCYDYTYKVPESDSIIWSKTEWYYHGALNGPCTYLISDTSHEIRHYMLGKLRYVEYFVNGSLMSSSDEQTYQIQRFETGEIRSTFTKAGRYFSYIEFDTTGVLRVQGQFSELYQSDSLGTWKWFDQSGRLSHKMQYPEEPEPKPEMEINERFELFYIYEEANIREDEVQHVIMDNCKLKRKSIGSYARFHLTIDKDGKITSVVAVHCDQDLLYAKQDMIIALKTLHATPGRIRLQPLVSVLEVHIKISE